MCNKEKSFFSKRCFVVWFANASPLPTFFISHNVIHPLITTSSSSPKVTYFTKIIIIIITLPVMLAGRSYMFCMSTEFIVSRMVMRSILIITLHFLRKRFLVFLKTKEKCYIQIYIKYGNAT